MVLAELIEMAGAPESWALVAVAALGFYHFRSGIGLLSRVGTVAQILGFVAVLLAAAAAGVIPGIDLTIALDRLVAALSGLLDALGGLVGRVA